MDSALNTQDFPIEILFHIIKYIQKTRDISEFSKVNRNWNAVAQESLFHQVELSSHSSLRKYVSMVCRMQKHKSVKRKWAYKNATNVNTIQYERMQSTVAFDMHSIQYSKWTFLFSKDASDILVELFKRVPNVKNWILPQLRIHKSLSVFSHLSNLEEMDISHFKGGKDGFLDSIFTSISLCCPKLKRLIIGASPCFDPSLNPMSSNSLEKLGICCDLEELKMVGQESLVHSHASHLNILFRSCRNLKKVEIQGLCCSEYRNVMRTLAVYNRGLVVLNVQLNSTITSYADLILLTLSKYTSQLQEFHFGPNPIFSDDAIAVLLECCPLLRILDISDSCTITNELMKSIGMYGKNIQSLNVSNGIQLSFKSFYELKRCKKLQVLEARGITRDKGLVHDVMRVLKEYTQIDVLYFTNDDGMMERLCSK